MQSLFTILFWPFYFLGDLIGRFPQDLREFRAADDLADRAVIVSYWLIGLAMLVAIGLGALRIAGSLLNTYRQYFA